MSQNSKITVTPPTPTLDGGDEPAREGVPASFPKTTAGGRKQKGAILGERDPDQYPSNLTTIALHPCAGVDNSPTVTSATLQPWVRVTAAPSAEEKVRLRSTVKEEPDLWSEVFYLAGLCFDLGLGVARTPE